MLKPENSALVFSLFIISQKLTTKTFPPTYFVFSRKCRLRICWATHTPHLYSILFYFLLFIIYIYPLFISLDIKLQQSQNNGCVSMISRDTVLSRTENGLIFQSFSITWGVQWFCLYRIQDGQPTEKIACKQGAKRSGWWRGQGNILNPTLPGHDLGRSAYDRVLVMHRMGVMKPTSLVQLSSCSIKAMPCEHSRPMPQEAFRADCSRQRDLLTLGLPDSVHTSAGITHIIPVLLAPVHVDLASPTITSSLHKTKMYFLAFQLLTE